MIKATNANDIDNGLDGWVCRKCRRDASAPTSSVPSSRASTSVPVPAPPPPRLSPPVATPPVSINPSVPAKLAADPSRAKRDPSSKVNKYKQSTVQKPPPEKVPKTEATADVSLPVIAAETQPAKIDAIPKVTASKRAQGKTEAPKALTRVKDEARAEAPSNPSAKETASAEASLLLSKKMSVNRPKDLSSDKAAAKKTAAKVASKSSRAVISPPISRSSGRHQSSSVVPDSEKESQFEVCAIKL